MISAPTKTPDLVPMELPQGSETPDRESITSTREVVFDMGGQPQSLATPHYDRSKLKAGNVIKGPAIIEQGDTTTLVLPDLVAETDRCGNLIVRLN